MLTGKKIFGKLEQIERRYEALRFEKVADASAVVFPTMEHFRQIPEGVEWQPISPGDRWGDDWLTVWFKSEVVLPEVCDGKRVFVRANNEGESLFIVDGEYRGVFDTPNHPVVMMTGKDDAGKSYTLGIEAYTKHSYPNCAVQDNPIVVTKNCRTFGGIEILLERTDVTEFVMDLKVLLSLVRGLDVDSLRRNVLMRELAKVFNLVPMIPDEVAESVWRPSLKKAGEIMKPLLATPNGPTVSKAGIIGHSHIDTAWLWPLSETWRKCARTFSSVLTLMEQYPEFIWIQSAPCHVEKVKELYPGMFEKIQARVAEGKWEPNGGMWVEPDCNIPSGEALVRQLLVGQNCTKEWYGYLSDTLWLPDVFGYSAALPQILQGSGIEFFCTTKISWNDTTRFPYDTFVWKGIDGTSVIAHFNNTHCFPLPQELIAQWKWIQHKDVQDRVLTAYGYGDGGGGPMNEMIEVGMRVGDLEGCPQGKHTTVSDFMKGVRDELTDLPEWSGELYLELHRGTLTSIAGVKKGNRKSELALRDAEFLATLATLAGRAYPADTLLDMWKRMLTNQFHDILPGSSIDKVNDEAIEEFGKIVMEAADISKTAAECIAGVGESNMLLVNTLGWERTGELELTGVPAGKSIEGAVCQQVEDPSGQAKLAVSGICLPSMSGKVVSLVNGEIGGKSSFTVSGDMVETPFATAKFDEIGRIVSLVDKTSGREVVAAGGVLNGLISGEDVPEFWDNWDIDADQELKMADERRLVSRKVVSEGPLQLRIRSEYKIGLSSSLVQDTIFHADTPRIDFDTKVEWSEKHRLLKAVFDVDVLTDTARHEIQYGHVERPTHRNLPQDRAKFEVVCHKWMDVAEHGFGAAIINDCKYGVSVHGKRIGLSLMKAGTHPDERGDAGTHTMVYSLLPHACGFSTASVIRPAYELNIPVRAFKASQDAKDIASLMSVDASNVIIESVKWAEDGKGFVVRFYEAEKSSTKAKVQFGVGVKSVSQCNLLEDDRKPLSLTNGAVELPFRAFEIKTLYCEV